MSYPLNAALSRNSSSFAKEADACISTTEAPRGTGPVLAFSEPKEMGGMRLHEVAYNSNFKKIGKGKETAYKQLQECTAS